MSDFSKHIENAGRRVGRQKAFCDFLTFAVCCLSLKTAEDEYLTTSKKYNSDEMLHFSNAFAVMVLEMDNKGEGLKDCLGDYFMEILSNERRGQFFTPQTICDFMSEIIQPANRETVSDCCCGSGRMFLSAAKKNRNLIFHGADIDLQCCQMTLINLCLNGLCGVVSHMDSLQYKEWRRWSIQIHPLLFIPYIREVKLTEEHIQQIEQIKMLPIENKTKLKAIQTTIQTTLDFGF